MPVINFASAFGKTAKNGAGFQPIIDQLSVKENQLMGNNGGALSSGDYDLLIKMAQGIHNMPNLTRDQRASMAVKISGYQKDKAVLATKKATDLPAINDTFKDNLLRSVQAFGNDPTTLVHKNLAIYQDKLQSLADAIDAADRSGSDSSNLTTELLQTATEANNLSTAANEAQKQVQSGQTQPITSMAAFITTNSKGQITDVQYDTPSPKAGYAPTTALYGGMQVFGKTTDDTVANQKVFKFGANTFKASNTGGLPTQDPVTGQLTFGTANTLTLNGNGKTGNFIPVDSKTNPVSVQIGVPTGGWAKAANGTYYNKLDDSGNYKKYINVSDPTKISSYDPNNVMPVSQMMGNSFNTNSTSTVDMSAPFTPPGVPTSPSIGGASSTPVVPPTTTPAAPGAPQAPQGPGNPAGGPLPATYGNPMGAPGQNQMNAPASTPKVARTSAPVERAPQTASGVAASLISRVAGAVKNIFSAG